MSSTNRTTRCPGSPDYYRTPIPAIFDFFDALDADWHDILDTNTFSFYRPFSILDPCAGGDSTHDMAYPCAIRQHTLWGKVARLTTVDIGQDSRAEIKTDYLNLLVASPAPQVIMTNPPFNIAQAVVEKAIHDVAEGGVVVVLLRLNFWGSQKRAEFFRRHMPVATFVHAQRMSFSEASGTDSAEYAHFIWQKGQDRKFSLLRRVEPKNRSRH